MYPNKLSMYPKNKSYGYRTIILISYH